MSRSRDELEKLVESVAREMISQQPERTAAPAADAARKRIAIGADHSAFRYKQLIVEYVGEDLGYEVLDCGTHSEESVDYPDIARAVALKINRGECERGILIDAAGIGSTMAANKIDGIRCALCHDQMTVENSRRHNDANVLALGSRVVNAGFARTLIRLWLRTPFDGGRHARRVEKIMRLESDT